MDEAFEDTCEELILHKENIAAAKRIMLKDDDASKLSEVFKVLGDPTRIKIINALSRCELCVCDIAEILGMTHSAISHQLRLLRNLRLVKYRKEGKMVIYSLDDEHILQLFSQGMEHVKHT